MLEKQPSRRNFLKSVWRRGWTAGVRWFVVGNPNGERCRIFLHADGHSANDSAQARVAPPRRAKGESDSICTWSVRRVSSNYSITNRPQRTRRQLKCPPIVHRGKKTFRVHQRHTPNVGASIQVPASRRRADALGACSEMIAPQATCVD